MTNYNPKSQLKVGGKMSEEGVNKVGLRLANAVIIAVSLFGISAIITAIGCILK
ncbi:hypothetical protein [Acinetobacter sp. HY1485]|uniref:hypothetical protein n=1 Tax=Acinetobacter sp. HY1485 TaxID=2970918 RepID=UPI0022B9BDF0|nr:hypothetical protein [Acinetobacter sp. HY1485]